MEDSDESLPPLYEELSTERNEIRILLVERDPKSSNFRCLLTPIPLKDAEDGFAALSYTWGDPTETVPLTVNGHVCQVTTNLYSALMNLTLLNPKLIIWIDALCINQSDPIERANQVRLMGDIYQKADHTLVWLGEGDDTSHLGMNAIDQFAQTYSDTNYNTKNAGDLLEGRLDEASFSAIANLLKRPWWSRAWTLQEIVLGKHATVACGTDVINWTAVSHIKAAFLDFDGLRNSKLFPVIQKYTSIFEAKLIEGKVELWEDERWRRKSSRPKQELIKIATICREYAATNPLDKIYSAVAMATSLPGLEIDYQITPCQLYTDFATLHIKTAQNLNILRDAGVGCSQTDSDDPVPSWVPDFRYPRPSSPIPLQNDANYATTMVAEFSNKSLMVEGIFVDQIISSTPRQSIHPNPWLKAAVESSPLTYRNSPIPYIQAYFRTILMDYNYNTGQPLNPKHKSFFAPAVVFSALTSQLDAEYIPNYIKTYAENERVPLNTALSINMYEQGDPDVEAAYLEFEDDVKNGATKHLEFSNFNTRVAILGFDRCLVKTTEGFMGLAPSGTKQGDWICVVKGCDAPLVLRKVEGKEEYTLVGECFVLGLMPHKIFGSGMFESRIDLISIV